MSIDNKIICVIKMIYEICHLYITYVQYMNLPLIRPVIINLWEKYCKCPCIRTDGQSEIQMPQIFNYKLYRKYFLEFFL